MAQPFKRILVCDAETAWDSKEYTLRKMTTEAYIRDPRFKVWGFCFKWYGDPGTARWIGTTHLKDYLARIDWSTTAILAQNTAFDGSILAWHYGITPAFQFDTLSMGRAVRGVETGNSLAKLAEAYGLPAKGNAVHSTDGMLDELPRHVEEELAQYCKHDVFLCEEIFKRLVMKDTQAGAFDYPAYAPHEWKYPVKELKLIDMTLRMFTRPLIQLDASMLTDAILEEKEKREGLLTKLGVTDATLASTPQFAALIEGLGHEVPTKKSPATGELIPALAKNDAMFQAMLNGDDENLSMLCEARVLVKSTSERTRAQRFLDISARGTLPVPLNYYGALTGRWTATKGGAINMQNMKRGSFLRKSLEAPDGFVFGVGDLSQIEPRVLAYMADYEDLLDIFRSGKDAYATFGESMFNMPGLNKEDHPVHRQSAKSAMLGAGYQLGWASFAAQLLVGFLGAPPVRYEKKFAKELGIDIGYIERFLDYEDNLVAMAGIPHVCSQQELLIHCVVAKKLIDLYRAAASPVVKLWAQYEQLIERSLAEGEEVQVKCLTFRKEEIVLPNGMSLLYPNLRHLKNEHGKKVVDKRGRPTWVYGEKETKLYAGKITNNCIGEGSEVLTQRGWVPIERVEQTDLVHDGVAFVSHGGKIYKGVQWCTAVDGVNMTPDHKVLTDEGWQAASQSPRPYRPTLRHVGSDERGAQHQKVALALSVRLWAAMHKAWLRCNQRAEARRHAELRVCDAPSYRGWKSHAWHDTPSGVRSLAQHDQPLHETFRARLQELWCAGNNRVRTLAERVRVFLGRHAARLSARAGAGSRGQREGVFAFELPLGFSAGEFDEPARHRALGGRSRVERSDRFGSHNNIQPDSRRVAGGTLVGAGGVHKPVWDILNAGPRQRFVVRGFGGPFIVHNCTQAIARCVMTDGMLRVDKRYPVVGTVHDELLCMMPEKEADEGIKWVIQQMTIEPKYLPGIPLAAEGGWHKRYGLAKK